jgi:hypothetical protein
MSDLDEFVGGYIATALWSSSVEEEYAAEYDLAADTSMFDAGLSAEDIAPDALASIRADCEAFLDANRADVDAYCEELGEWHGSDSVRGSDARYSALERAGGDFWLTRNGHGAGFWDRGLPDDLGRRLSDAATAYGEVWIYVGDDGKVYA